jgi:CRISPR-associated protein Cas2
MRSWIIGYDITEPGRLQRIYRTMLRHATPIEYSIFLLSGTERDKQRCLDEVIALIDPDTDDLRCYPLPERGLQERIGRPTLPPGIHWSVLPSTL